MITKHAGWFDFLKGGRAAEIAKNPYVIAAAAPLIGAGVDAGISQVRGMVATRNKAKAYKSMLAENPVLKRRPKDSQKFFNTLYNANPNLAKDPLVSSSWVHTQMEQQVPGVPHAGVVEGVQSLTKIRQQMRDTSGGRPGTFRALADQIQRPVHEGILDRAKRTRISEMKSQQERMDASASTLKSRLGALQMPLKS